ncbi:hypothetical protein FACS1894140_1830 [Spirochaetia bacterium]|nr:hypothetical protein FACS1894140_1830 [Spirochaetia bacterium]
MGFDHTGSPNPGFFRRAEIPLIGAVVVLAGNRWTGQGMSPDGGEIGNAMDPTKLARIDEDRSTIKGTKHKTPRRGTA